MISTEWIQSLIDSDELWRFYKHPEWIRLKKHILKEHHYECYECKRNGKLTRYDIDAKGTRRIISTVHHVNHVRKHPELAMSRTYRDESGAEKPNLIPVCKSCHNQLHPEKNQKRKNTEGFTNKEQW